MDYFSLDSLSGNLSTAKLIDRESLSNSNGIITLIVRVSIHIHINDCYTDNIHFFKLLFLNY